MILQNLAMKTLQLTRKQQIDTEEIVYLESDINYTNIFTTFNEKFVVATTLMTLHHRLDNTNFVRINRSNVLNIAHVADIHRNENNKYIAQMLNGQEFIVSRRRVRGIINGF
jgi:DNA-binding LytR/AlgR family response regulator